MPTLGNIPKCAFDDCDCLAYCSLENVNLCEIHYADTVRHQLEETLREKEELENKLKKADELKKKKIEEDKKKVKEEAKDEYTRMKNEFEENNFQVGTMLFHTQSDGQYRLMKITEAAPMFEDMIFTTIDNRGNIKEESFYPKWRKDPTKKKFDRIDFVPNRNECPKDVYNLFTGFEAEKLHFEMTELEINILVKHIISLLRFLTGGFERYLCLWLASIIQKPYQKTEVSQFIRDACSLFVCSGGIGKNLFFEWFGYFILGEKYFHVISNNKELYSDFNGIFEGKLLILVEETSGRDNHSNAGILKANTTKKKQVINKKGVNQYTVRDYTNWVFTTNEKNALPIRQEDRRFVCYDSNTEMRGNVQYFNNLVRLMEMKETQYAFFQYLKNLKTYDTPIEFQTNIPITPAYKDIRRMNAPIIEKWLADKSTLDIIDTEQKSSFFYNHFNNWLHSTRNDSFKISNTAFTQELKNAVKAFCSSRTKDGYTYLKGNKDIIIYELKKLYLIDEDYEHINEIKSVNNSNSKHYGINI
jgi:hypothetical protein